MNFLIDMPLSPNLARWLIDHGHDAIHVSQIGMESASDTEILERAASERRTVITVDLDYPRLLALSAATQPSLILFRNGNWSDGAVIAHIRELLLTVNAAEIETSIIVIDRHRLRRRRLPIE